MEGGRGLAERISARLTVVEGRRFGLTVGVAFLVLSGLAWWRGRDPVAVIFAAIGGLLIAGGLVLPTRLGPVLRAWMGLAHLLSRITTPVFLGIVFYFVVTPVGLVMRLVGARPLPRPRRGSTGWIPRPAEARRRVDLQRQF